ncbi:MAG: DUF2798 domain-containing protein [Spirochaetes bacterium]|nr:DUF2798 domain-containing protein [Spirochaetota bacterium]
MPQTKFQKLFFMLLTVMLSVTSFVIYNIAISRGGMSNEVFILALKQIPIEFSVAFPMQLLLEYRLSKKLAFRAVNPQKDKPITIILAITCGTICIMCPSMSFAATIIHDGINSEFAANFLQKMVYNFPFAFFTQIFIIGPTVRMIFRNTLGRKSAA